MSSPAILKCAKKLGITPDKIAAKADVAMGMGQDRIEAITTAYLELADPGFNAYESNCWPHDPAEEDAVCQRDAHTPVPWELTEPEETYAESVKNRRLQESKMRVRNSTQGEQGSQRGPLHDGKEDA